MMQNGLASQGPEPATIWARISARPSKSGFRARKASSIMSGRPVGAFPMRLIGVPLSCTHSDDKGSVLPPRLAPVKVVLVPIYRKDEEKSAVLEAAHKIAKDLGAKLDDREGQSPGSKFFHWERLGVLPVLELGPRDLAAGKAVRSAATPGPRSRSRRNLWTARSRLRWTPYRPPCSRPRASASRRIPCWPIRSKRWRAS